jgi:DNA-binding NarL/FixJ family response regulator
MEIFLVEDSPMLRQRLSELLNAVPGAHVAGHADEAQAAVAAILDTKPDVAIVDLSLAKGTGFDVLKALSRQAPQVDVYMLSNFSSEPYRQLASRLGARGFFDKSSEFQRVRDIIAERASRAKATLPD